MDRGEVTRLDRNGRFVSCFDGSSNFSYGALGRFFATIWYCGECGWSRLCFGTCGDLASGFVIVHLTSVFFSLFLFCAVREANQCERSIKGARCSCFFFLQVFDIRGKSMCARESGSETTITTFTTLLASDCARPRTCSWTGKGTCLSATTPLLACKS